MKQGLVRLLYNFGKRFMGWTLHMIMCVLLCYPVSIHMLQLLSTGRPISSCRKVQMETPESIRDSDSREMGVIDRPVRCLPSYPHPPKLKEVPMGFPQFTGIPVHLPPFRPSYSPTGLYSDCKGGEADGPHKVVILQQYLDDRLIMALSQEEAQVNTQTVVDLTQSLGWIINQEKSELKPTRVFTFVVYKYHLDSALVNPLKRDGSNFRI